STSRQLVSPEKVISPMPSQVVKLSTSTPMSGTTPKATKNSSAGRASKGSTRSRVCGAAARRAEPAGAPEAIALIADPPMMRSSRWSCRSLADELVHVVGELLRRDRQLEQLGDVVEQRLGGGRAERLVPRLAEVLGVVGDVVGELEEVGVRRLLEQRLGALQHGQRADVDPRLGLLVGNERGEVPLGDLLLLR